MVRWSAAGAGKLQQLTEGRGAGLMQGGTEGHLHRFQIQVAGMLALGVHTGGVLGKLLSETIEAIDPGQVEGVAAVGASRLHIISLSVVPQVLPNFLSYILLRFESDIRSAAVIGMVGGGGIGFYLWDTIRAFNDREAATVILLIIAMVMGIDVLSARIRQAVI